MTRKKLTYEEARDYMTKMGYVEGKHFGPFDYNGDQRILVTLDCVEKIAVAQALTEITKDS